MIIDWISRIIFQIKWLLQSVLLNFIFSSCMFRHGCYMSIWVYTSVLVHTPEPPKKKGNADKQYFEILGLSVIFGTSSLCPGKFALFAFFSIRWTWHPVSLPLIVSYIHDNNSSIFLIFLLSQIKPFDIEGRKNSSSVTWTHCIHRLLLKTDVVSCFKMKSHDPHFVVSVPVSSCKNK